MAFKRALWKSGLVYERTCEQCKTTFRYMDDKLDFRPWYADGFVYCPHCKTPLRHNEAYAVSTANGEPVPAPTAYVSVQPNVAEKPMGESAFCTQCGRAFGAGDLFCAQCGNKR